MNLDQVLEARAIAPLVVHNVAAVDTDVWSVVQYVPDGGEGGAAATLTIATGGETWTFTVDAAAPTDTDRIGAAGVIDGDATTYDTYGELADYINGLPSWRMYLVGAIRSDAIKSSLAKSSTSCFGDNGLTIYADTSDTNTFSVGISGEKFVNNGLTGHYTDDDDEVENCLLYGGFNVTGLSVVMLRAYSGKQGTTETSLFSGVTLTTATLYELGEANLSEIELKAIRGERLILRVYSPSAGGTLSVPVINVHAKSAVLSGSRVVDEDNY